jgi:DNA-binding transcriptional MerR regulator
MSAEHLAPPPQGDHGELRVVCTHSLDHLRIASLSQLGLSLQDIETITGLNRAEFQHLVRD